MSFPIDRRALASSESLGLSEARVRDALKALVAVGFLQRVPLVPLGGTSGFRRTPDGWRRKPVLYRFGSVYADAFAQANRRAQKARDGRLASSRPRGTGQPHTAVCGLPKASTQLTHKLRAQREGCLWARNFPPAEPLSPTPTSKPPWIGSEGHSRGSTPLPHRIKGNRGEVQPQFSARLCSAQNGRFYC